MFPVSATITGRRPSPSSSRLLVRRPSGGRFTRYQAMMSVEQAAHTSATSFSRSSIEWMEDTGRRHYHGSAARFKAGGCLSSDTSSRVTVSRDGQREREGAPHVELALAPDPPAVRLDDEPADVEPQSQA